MQLTQGECIMANAEDITGGKLPPGITRHILDCGFLLRGRKEVFLAVRLIPNDWFPDGHDSRGRVIRRKVFVWDGRRVRVRLPARGPASVSIEFSEAEIAEIRAARARAPMLFRATPGTNVLHMVPNRRDPDTASCLSQLLKAAVAGEIVGIAFVALSRGGGEFHIKDFVGECCRRPGLTRGLLRYLDDKLRG
jgi:hypothetical protein